MTDQARTRRAAVALAARGEGQAAAALGALALQDSPLPADSLNRSGSDGGLIP